MRSSKIVEYEETESMNEKTVERAIENNTVRRFVLSN